VQQYGSASIGWMDCQRRLAVDSCKTVDLCRGVAKLVKAPDFDSGMRRFESFFPCQNFQALRCLVCM
jgi:hypothetical protein